MLKRDRIVQVVFASLMFLSAVLLPGLASAQSCQPGYEPCDGGCMPYGSVCCYDGVHYCDPGESCDLSNGTCNSGSSSGGSCGFGYAECDSGCIPSGSVCCYFGNNTYCPSGTSCSLDGTCSSGGGGGGGGSSGGGSCPSGQIPCGDYCMPSGRVCCEYAGRPDLNCPVGTTCTASGLCDGNSENGSVDSTAGGNGSSSSSGGGQSGSEVCNDYGFVDGCDTIQTCCGPSGCRYITDGESFYCESSGNCYSAARDLVDYCTDRGSFWGCNASGPMGGAPWWSLIAAALLLGRRRARKPILNRNA